uniref:Fam-b protein n=1 Tax=Strongyloides venezuelensis TaxID=75913 RepID=A0A0K0FYC8_STRVS
MYYINEYFLVFFSCLYLFACCGKNSIEHDGCKKRGNDYIYDNNYTKCEVSKKESMPTKMTEKHKSYRNINSKKSSKKEIYKNSDSNNAKLKPCSSLEPKKKILKKECVKIQKQARSLNPKKINYSVSKSKKIISKSSNTSSSFEILVPTKEKTRLPNLPAKVIKIIEKFKPPNVISHFKTQQLTKEPRLVHALDRIEIYLNRIRSY